MKEKLGVRGAIFSSLFASFPSVQFFLISVLSVFSVVHLIGASMLHRIKIHSYEVGLYFHDGEFRGLLDAGRHWFFDPLGRVYVETVSLRAPWLVHDKLDVIADSGALAERAIVLDLKDYERGLVWIDGRFSHVLPPGLHAYWTALREVRGSGGCA